MRKTATEWKAYYSDPKFEQQYTYEGHDLGATCTEDGTSILLWSPVAETVNVRFFQDGETGKPYRTGYGKGKTRRLGLPDKRNAPRRVL